MDMTGNRLLEYKWKCEAEDIEGSMCGSLDTFWRAVKGKDIIGNKQQIIEALRYDKSVWRDIWATANNAIDNLIKSIEDES